MIIHNKHWDRQLLRCKNIFGYYFGATVSLQLFSHIATIFLCNNQPVKLSWGKIYILMRITKKTNFLGWQTLLYVSWRKTVVEVTIIMRTVSFYYYILEQTHCRCVNILLFYSPYFRLLESVCPTRSLDLSENTKLPKTTNRYNDIYKIEDTGYNMDIIWYIQDRRCWMQNRYNDIYKILKILDTAWI